MHHTGPLPLIFEGPEQGLGVKNCQNASLGVHMSEGTFSQFAETYYL